MVENIEEYKKLMTEIIQKQAVILGPQIAILKARNVQGITVKDNGEITDITAENPQEVMQKLVDEYVSLSGEIVKKAMEPLLGKYPSIKV